MSGTARRSRRRFTWMPYGRRRTSTPRIDSSAITSSGALRRNVVIQSDPLAGTPYQHIFAALYARFAPEHEAMVADRKRRLLRTLRGLVVEIGPGTGANLRYFPP